MHRPSISIILPVYQNAASLRELYCRLKVVLDTITDVYEILFVNDASPDHSASILQELAQMDTCVTVITFDENKGQNNAVFKGLEECKGTIAVVLDADLQDPPEMISSIVSKLEEGYDAVFAGRHGNYESPMRLLTSKIFKYCLHRLCHLPRDAGLFVAMNRSVIDALKEIRMPKPFVVAMIGLTGCKTFSIPFVRLKQKENKTAYTFRMRLKIALEALYSVACLRKQLKHIQK